MTASDTTSPGLAREPGTVGHYVWRLIDAADSMRDHWAEADHDPARRKELWYQLHHAADAARTAIEEGPEAAAEYVEAERKLMERLAAK